MGSTAKQTWTRKGKTKKGNLLRSIKFVIISNISGGIASTLGYSYTLYRARRTQRKEEEAEVGKEKRRKSTATF